MVDLIEMRNTSSVVDGFVSVVFVLEGNFLEFDFDLIPLKDRHKHDKKFFLRKLFPLEEEIDFPLKSIQFVQISNENPSKIKYSHQTFDTMSKQTC